VKLDYTLKDLENEYRSDGDRITYNTIYRAVVTLEEAGLISPWRGSNNERHLTLDQKRVVETFLALVKTGKAFKYALLETKIQILEAENKRLKALLPVEVKPPWWKQLLSWWWRIWPRGKASRSQSRAR
jgi:Fe2+ or Zn2+ uptake regulation protein